MGNAFFGYCWQSMFYINKHTNFFKFHRYMEHVVQNRNMGGT